MRIYLLIAKSILVVILKLAGMTIVIARSTIFLMGRHCHLKMRSLMLLFHLKFLNIYSISLIFPLTVFAYLINAFFPKRHDLFCNIVVLAKKKDVR